MVGRMSTITEIEAAVDRLSPGEQAELLRQLANRLRSHQRATGPASRELWLGRLRALRAAIGTGGPTLSSAQVLDELRQERN